MQDELLTRCPHCGTTFKLGQAQLNTAQGAVRCGACLQVFHASEYIIDSQDVDLDPDLAKLSEEIDRLAEDESPVEAPSPSIAETESINETELTSDYLEDADFSEFHDPDLGAQSFDEANQVNLNEPMEENTDPFFGDSEIEFNKSSNKSSDDEAWAEALLRELDSEDKFGEPELDDPSLAATQSLQESKGTLTIDDDDIDESFDEDALRKEFANISSDDGIFDLDSETDNIDFSEGLATEAAEEENPFADLSEEEDEAFSPFGDIEEKSDFGLNTADESWAKAMLEELEEETREYPQELQLTEQRGEEETWYGTGKAKPESTFPAPAKTQDLGDDFINLVDGPNTDNFLESDEIPDLLSDDGNAGMQDDFLVDIDDQSLAVDITERPSKDDTKRFAGGIALNILAALTLFGQYIWFNYDQLSRDSQYRPGLQAFCDMVGCTLPPQQDISKIRGSNLVVRSHPKEVNSLVVDTIVYNRANFQQPFPLLELVFSDLNGALIAKRAFKPEEYQKGGLKNLEAMPTNTPIHLSLEIVDPGKEAVNYEMHFLATDSNAG